MPGTSGGTPRTEPYFRSEEALYSHLAAAHDVVYKSSSKADVEFCYYCETFLGPFDDPVAHTESHELDAHNLVKFSGYEAPVAGRLLRPCLCILCYHDDHLPLHKRNTTFAPGSQAYHFPACFSKIADDVLTKCPAYPEMCSCDIDFSKDDLKDHLSNTQGITTTKARRAPTKRKKALSIIDAGEDDGAEHSEIPGVTMADPTPAPVKRKRPGSTMLTPKDVNAVVKPFKSATKI
jgi:hypothetical protein